MSLPVILGIGLGLLLSSPRPALYQQESVKPGINQEYRGNIDVQSCENQFESEGREAYQKRASIVEALKLRPGDEVADIGTGTGLFVPLFSQAVGTGGRVYAVDIADEFVQHVRAKARRLGLANVEAVLCTDRSVNLPPGSIDVAFLCDVYHHFEFPQDSLNSIKAALRPGGTLVIIDYQRVPGKSPEWRLNHIRAGKEKFQTEIETAGFRKTNEFDFLKDNYFLVFRRP